MLWRTPKKKSVGADQVRLGSDSLGKEKHKTKVRLGKVGKDTKDEKR